MLKKHSLGFAIAILMGLMAWNLWQTREEAGQLRRVLSEQCSGALANTVAPAGCPVNTAGNTTTAQVPPDPSKVASMFAPPVVQVAQDSNQAVTSVTGRPRMVIPPGTDIAEAIKLIQQDHDRIQQQGSVGMNPFGSPR